MLKLDYQFEGIKMAKISHRDKILLGYNPNCLSNSSSSRRNSEVDFSDVFGGPPRCSSSTHEFHNNEIDSEEEEDDDGGDGNWYGLRREKPVFGNGNGNQIGVRKRYASDGFYNDIFGGDQPLMSCSLSPRHHHISRSPAAAAAAADPSSSPSQFSLPGSMTNTTEIMSSTSINQNWKFYGRSLSGFNRSIQNHSNLNGDDSGTPTPYQPTSLSRHNSADEDHFKSDTKPYDCSKCSTLGNLDNNNNNNNMQFHFSIYKWANKGVPNIVMSSRKRNPFVGMEIDNRNHVDVKDDVISSSKTGRIQSTARAREGEQNNGDDIVVDFRLEDCKVDMNPIHPHNEVGVNEVVDHSEKDSSSSKVKKSNMKQPLYTFFGQDKQGSKKATTPEKGRKQSNVNESEKPTSLNKEVFPSYKISRKSKVRESGTNEPHKGQVLSGKVDDFVKIFNQEDSSAQVKTKRDVMGSQNHTSRLMMDTPKFEPLTEADSTLPTKNKGKMQADFENTWSDFIHLVDGESLLSGEPEFNFNGSESNIDVIKGSATKSSAPSVEDNQAKGVMQNMYSQIAAESKEETQSYERKIRQWSKGKEGNIRALLTTMQNVLWANSGWKPIPLVDIIEANAVKKAYQRALLYLHPDKLQQKGAPPHHKFIAEKVFDILQEAWDQFNSIGMF